MTMASQYPRQIVDTSSNPVQTNPVSDAELLLKPTE